MPVRTTSKSLLLRVSFTDAKYRPEAAMGSDVAGLRNATSGSLTDRLTREHRMTLDEARLILNVKKEDSAERMLQVRANVMAGSFVCCSSLRQHYEHLFKANSPPPPPEKPAAGTKKPSIQAYSHYLQSKVVKARERLEAELAAQAEPDPVGQAHSAEKPAPPPTESGKSS